MSWSPVTTALTARSWGSPVRGRLDLRRSVTGARRGVVVSSFDTFRLPIADVLLSQVVLSDTVSPRCDSFKHLYDVSSRVS
jgi:hypothetical protein